MIQSSHKFGKGGSEVDDWDSDDTNSLNLDLGAPPKPGVRTVTFAQTFAPHRKFLRGAPLEHDLGVLDPEHVGLRVPNSLSNSEPNIPDENIVSTTKPSLVVAEEEIVIQQTQTDITPSPRNEKQPSRVHNMFWMAINSLNPRKKE